MADEETEVEETAAEQGGGKKKIIMIVAALILIGVGAVAGMTFFGGDSESDTAEETVEEKPPSAPPIYTSLHPPLVVNFKDTIGDGHVMQVTMDVMTRDQNVANAIREHTPAIRNALILHYSGAVYEEVTTRVGKEKMLADGLQEIQTILSREIDEPGAEAVYFTALVIQ